MRRRGRLGGVAAIVAMLAGAGAAYAAGTFDPAVEQSNYSKLNERFQYVVSAPDYQVKLREDSARSTAELAGIRATDPERNPDAACASYAWDCAGDIRLADWAQNGYGVVQDVLYTN